MKKEEKKEEKEALVSCRWGSPSAGEPREELPGRAVEAISRGETRPGVSEGGAGGWVRARSAAGVALSPPTPLRGAAARREAAPGRRWPPVAAVAGPAARSPPPAPSPPRRPLGAAPSLRRAGDGGAMPAPQHGEPRPVAPVFFPPVCPFPQALGPGEGSCRVMLPL